MPGVAAGNMPDAAWKKANRGESWTTGDSYNYGIGQGFTLASPLQLGLYVARIASGIALKPRLIRAIGGVPEPVAPAEPLAVSPGHLQIVREGMFAVSNEGTAYRSRIVDPTMLMAGKTGTSQVRIITAAERAAGVTKNEQLPWNRRDHALFVCYAPYDKPRYAVAQIVEHGGGGSAVAAPIARDILLYALYGGMPPLSAYPSEQREQIEEMQRRLQPIPAATGAGAPAPQRDRA
jgi:penicillin-binding protein 2